MEIVLASEICFWSVWHDFQHCWSSSVRLYECLKYTWIDIDSWGIRWKWSSRIGYFVPIFCKCMYMPVSHFISFLPATCMLSSSTPLLMSSENEVTVLNLISTTDSFMWFMTCEKGVESFLGRYTLDSM